MEKLINFLKDKITDKISFEEIVNVFEQMCNIPLEEDMIFFETGTFTTFADEPMFQISLVRQFSNEDEEKKRFRNLIEKMYERGINKVYHYNPFTEENKVADQVEYLNNVCDFLSGYNLIEEELLEHFKKCLKKVIEQENKEKSENLIKVNYEFYYQLEKLKHDFKTKYEEVELNDLYDLLNYYNQNTEN